MKWILAAYVGVGVYVTIIHVTNPAKLMGWMADRGFVWHIWFVVNVVLWPLLGGVSMMHRGQWSGYRPMNWASMIGLMLLPKRPITVNAINPFHAKGHFRFEASVPAVDIDHYAENGELYAMRSDNWNYVGCACKRSPNDEWIDTTGVPRGGPGKLGRGIEWYAYMTKIEYEKWLADVTKPFDQKDFGSFR